MPAANDDLLFLGVTVGPIRDLVAGQLDARYHDIAMPCVGRWSTAVAVAARHRSADIDSHITASDLSLLSSLIGYLADPELDPRHLGVELPDRFADLVDDDPFRWTATVMLALKLGMLAGGNVHTASIRREVWANRIHYRDRLVDGLRATVDILGPVTYAVADVRDELATFTATAGEASAMFLAPPTYKGGYTKMYGEAEAALWPAGTQLAVAEFVPDELPALLEPLTDHPALVLVYVQHGDNRLPAGWTKLAILHESRDRVDYLVANHDTGTRRTITHFDRPAALWPVFTDQEIRPDSQINFVLVDRYTALHYRDLFVHRLAGSDAELYGLMLIDGRAVTAFGLMARDLRRDPDRCLFLVFGISITSARYARLGKLFMLCLTSSDFRSWLLAQQHYLHSTPPGGIRTANITHHHEGKIDRGVSKLVRRGDKTAAGFKLQYHAPFRDESWADTLTRWLAAWGQINRGGHDAENPGPAGSGEAQRQEAGQDTSQGETEQAAAGAAP
jgi:hypothetical protein